MIRNHASCTALLIGLLAHTSGQAAESAKVQVIIQPAASQVHQGEVLFCKLTLSNQGADPIRMERPLGNRYGAATWELRRKGAREFARVQTPWSGIKGCTLFAPLEIPGGGRTVACDPLLRSRDSLLFSEVGMYVLRAGVIVAGKQIYSEPVEVRVAPKANDQRETIERAAAFLDSLLGIGLNPSELAKAGELERALDQSHLKKSLRYIAA